MKNLRPVLLILFILLITASSFSQRKFEGRVTEVLDGKTVVIDSDSGKITAELQYIEVPETENPLSQTVRDHLGGLVLDKRVTFHLQGFSYLKMTGQIYVGNVDVAQQMLRDGAAWHLPTGQNSQTKAASDLYDSTQELAKNEKRGIWADEKLKPAGLVRSETFEKERRQERYDREHRTEVNAAYQSSFAENNRREASKRPGKWGDVNPKMRNIGAVYNGYNAESKTGFLTTGFNPVKDIGQVIVDPTHKMALDVTYIYKEDDGKGRTGNFTITFDSSSDQDWWFSKANDLILSIGDKDTVVGKARRQAAKDYDTFKERLTYQVSRSTIEKMYNGGNVSIRIGKYTIWMGEGNQRILGEMLASTE